MSVTIRLAVEDDARGIAEVHSASWRHAYRGIVPQSHLDGMAPERTVERWRDLARGEDARIELLVAADAGRILGFQAFGPARPPDFGYPGELYAAYVLPEATGKGLGRAMVARGVEGLAARGMTGMIVWVMEANARGVRFYRDILKGTPVDGSRQSFDIAGATIWEVAYGFRPLPVIAAKG